METADKIPHLILNSPYEEPKEHWRYHRERRKFLREQGRRQAGYLVATPKSRDFDDPGVFVPIPLANEIRKRVGQWRKAGYPGVSGMTRRLLSYWSEREAGDQRFFFCQLEAAETLIWLTEAPESEKTGIEIPLDGGAFRRLCSKMATGTGKTVVMAMMIAWHILNKVSSPQDTRFAKNVFIVAPGLTVKSRLSVLQPSDGNNYYEEFDIVPGDLMDKLRQGRVRICNWHALGWESEERIKNKKSVDKRGVKSDRAYTGEVLGDMASARNILVINDEAHHAWRINPEAQGKYLRQRDMKDSAEEATIWVSGLDRIHRTRGILACYDFSATPFAPSGNRGSDEALFDWIVSDFSLSDAIEAGLVKTPRVVVRDNALQNAKNYKSRLYHIYNNSKVKDDLNRRANPEEALPSLVINAYYLLGFDWRETANLWKEKNAQTPPVMITVANRTETAARVKHALENKRIEIAELCDSERILHIDSKVLAEAESADESRAIHGAEFGGAEETAVRKLTQAERAEQLRKQVDTVGKHGEPGEQIQKVISVGMLSEGWDAKTVTHIMGLRAFTSQLLCEQVVGRGLRRTSYEVNEETGLFEPEYVNVFGVPFSFLPHESAEGGDPPPVTPKTAIEPDPDKAHFEIRWPNVLRIEHAYHPRLFLDRKQVGCLELDAGDAHISAELAPTVDGKTDVTKFSEIDLGKLARKSRMQTIIFKAARDVYDQMKPDWEGNKEFLLAQIVQLAEQFIRSDFIRITPLVFEQNELRRRVMLILNMSKIVNHLWQAIRFDNTERLVPVFDKDRPIRSTADMRTWHTGKPCEYTRRSHINFCVFDSTWEASEADKLDRHPGVDAWVKNDHLGFDVLYIHDGVVRKHWPDFIIRMKSGDFLVLEVKGQDKDRDKSKRRFLEEWIRAVNADGRFGRWHCAVSRKPSDIADILDRVDRAAPRERSREQAAC